MKYAPIIKEIGRGAKGSRSIDVAQAERVFGAMFDGEVVVPQPILDQVAALAALARD